MLNIATAASDRRDSHRLWSLWDLMKPFYADNFLLLFDLLNARAQDTRFGLRRLNADDRKMLDMVFKFEAWCLELNLPSSAAKISQIRLWDTNGSLNIGKLRDLYKDLHGRLQDELDDRHFLSLSVDEAKNYWQNKSLLEPDVAAKFSPSLLEDLEEAGSCLAVERATAAVFHLMRVMEAAVGTFASKHNVKITNDLDWGTILAAIKPAIEGLPKTNETEKALKDQHSEVFSLLYHVKQAWRNPTMHPKRTYTPEQAKEIFAAVKSYLTCLGALL
jgi:hypothetical protein